MKDGILEKKFQRLKDIIKALDSVILAYSGGVDSSFLLAVCSRVLNKKALAVTSASSSLPRRELKEARILAKKLRAHHLIIETDELRSKDYINNPPDRCYYCKKELFAKLKQIKKKYKARFIIDGSNYDDDSDYRPGSRAGREFGVRSPLKEAGLTKNDIRVLCRSLNLSLWNKPSFACLASRIPYNKKIDAKTLGRIEKAEDFLISLGFSQVRVRDFGELAKIEVEKKKVNKLITNYKLQITNYLKKLGYRQVTVDLEGYRMGSLNES